jgi:hypothetical protein
LFVCYACNNQHVTPNSDSSSKRLYDSRKDGIVPDEQTAIKVAEAVLPSFYGPEVLDEKPFVAKLVGDSVWYIDGSWNHGKNFNGGTFHIEIRKRDCTILRIIHGK